MIAGRIITIFLLSLITRVGYPDVLPEDARLFTESHSRAARMWPVAAPLDAPEGLRPCCAFGYNLKAEFMGIRVPFFRLDNVVEANGLGQHEYNDRLLGAILNLAGLSAEKNGIIYTRHGGFVDIAHVRDSADITFYLFSQLRAHQGQTFTLNLSDELTHREIQFYAAQPLSDPAAVYTRDVWLAGWLAFRLAAWHEIAQSYGFRSVSVFSESVSAFSPEDLYSNLLGVRLAVMLLLNGHGSSLAAYNVAMTRILPEALHKLGAGSAALTRLRFNMLDGRWWDSQQAMPNKFLVLKRNYQIDDDRWPMPVLGETQPPLHLTLPQAQDDEAFSQLAELRFCPSQNMARLPVPKKCYTTADFAVLARNAEAEDTRQFATQSAND